MEAVGLWVLPSGWHGMDPLGYKRTPHPPTLRPLACPALQLICIFGCAAGGRGKGHKGSEQKLCFGVARMPAFPLHVLAVGHLWHPSGIPQKHHHAQPSPTKHTHCHQDQESTIAAPQKLSHFLYAWTVCWVFRLMQVNEFFMLPFCGKPT